MYPNKIPSKSLRCFVDPKTMYNRPNPAEYEPSGEELEETVDKSHALEIGASASGDHRAHTRLNDVEDEADEGQGGVKLDDGIFAATNGVIGGFRGSGGHSSFFV